jgi:hypothetical protein
MKTCSESNILEEDGGKHFWPSLCHLFPDFVDRGEHPASKEKLFMTMILNLDGS